MVHSQARSITRLLLQWRLFCRGSRKRSRNCKNWCTTPFKPNYNRNYNRVIDHKCEWTRIQRRQNPQVWIQDFRQGAPTPKGCVLTYYFAQIEENCIKIKEIRPRDGASPASLSWIRHCMFKYLRF